MSRPRALSPALAAPVLLPGALLAAPLLVSTLEQPVASEPGGASWACYSSADSVRSSVTFDDAGAPVYEALGRLKDGPGQGTWAVVTCRLDGNDDAEPRDLSGYATLQFRARSWSGNAMGVRLEDEVETYRSTLLPFEVGPEWSTVSMPLEGIESGLGRVVSISFVPMESREGDWFHVQLDDVVLLAEGDAPAKIAQPPLPPPVPAPGAGYRVHQREDGALFFVGPDGEQFLSLGINSVNATWGGADGYEAWDAEAFNGDVEAWAARARTILRDAGLNTLGAWCHPTVNDGTFLETPLLDIPAAGRFTPLMALRPGFREAIHRRAARAVQTRPHPEAVLGVFVANEMPWRGEAPWEEDTDNSLLEEALDSPPLSPERLAAERFIAAKAVVDVDPEPTAEVLLALTPADSLAALRDDFIGHVAEEFFSRAHEGVRSALPGRLDLGVRLAGSAPDPVWPAYGRHVDVISVNSYQGRPRVDPNLLRLAWENSRRPLMITEYSWRGRENLSGNPNTKGAGVVVDTQAERAALAGEFIAAAAQEPTFLGAHWFAWADQPPGGRADGEDSNYGLVSIKGEPYAGLVAAMKAANALAATRAGATTRPFPDAIVERPVIIDITPAPGARPVDILAQRGFWDFQSYGASDARVDIVAALPGVVTLRAGREWGAGLIIRPSPDGRRLVLANCEAIVIEGDFPKGLRIEVNLDEGGAAAPESMRFETPFEDDGESWALGEIVTVGGPQSFRLLIPDARPRAAWGNQEGNRRLDLGSMRAIALAFPANQPDAEFRLERIVLQPMTKPEGAP